MLQIIEKNGEKYVTLSELYSKLGLIGANYQRFIKEQILENEFADKENDFSSLGMKSTGGRRKEDYLLSLNFAKDIILRSKSKVGKVFRDYLISLDNKKESADLLTHEQILYLVRLKEIFKYLSNCNKAKDMHMEKFVAQSDAKNPYAEFYAYRNKILGLGKKEIDSRIKNYFSENAIFIKAKTQIEKLAILDKYEILRNGIWDFLESGSNDQSMKIANLAMQIAKMENLTMFKKNEDNLFDQKEPNNEIKRIS